MSLYVLKPKTENKNITQDNMIGTGKNLKAFYKPKKINNQNSLGFFTREFIASVSFVRLSQRQKGKQNDSEKVRQKYSLRKRKLRHWGDKTLEE